MTTGAIATAAMTTDAQPVDLPLRCGGIVVCGGKSSRMGVDKASLVVQGQPLLRRVVDVLQQVVAPVVVVAAVGQRLPELPEDVCIAHDRRADRGPLEGLAAGWAALPNQIEAAYLSSCDAPLLRPAFVRRMVELLGADDAAVVVASGCRHALSAVLRRSVCPAVQRLLEQDQLKVAALFDLVHTRDVAAAELADVDPHLESLLNVNTPDALQRLLVQTQQAALPQPVDQHLAQSLDELKQIEPQVMEAKKIAGKPAPKRKAAKKPPGE